ncbi:MAG: hypothetical protein JWP04_839, partial [Belnapia sp.]|nr:hypothetical protein [Belnapia sp.]
MVAPTRRHLLGAAMAPAAAATVATLAAAPPAWAMCGGCLASASPSRPA